MTLKLSLVITFLIVAATAATEDGTFSLESVWKNTTRTRTPLRGRSGGEPAAIVRLPHWIERNQRYHDDVLVAFNSFPRKLSDEADYVKPAMQRYLTKLTELSASESKTVSSGATIILEAFTQIKVDDRSAQGIIDEFSRMLPILMTAYRGATSTLTPILGSEQVNKVIANLRDAERDFRQYVDAFNSGDQKRETDYEPIMKSIRALTITINSVISLNANQLTNEVVDALIILRLVIEHVLICTNGLSSTSKVVLHNQRCAENQSC